MYGLGLTARRPRYTLNGSTGSSGRPPLARDDLERVAGVDVLDDLRDRRLVLLARVVALPVQREPSRGVTSAIGVGPARIVRTRRRISSAAAS